MITRVYITKIFFLLTLLLPFTSLGNEEKQRFIIGIPNDLKFPLYSAYNGMFHGKYRLILDKFADENDYEFKYVIYKNNELYYQFYNKKVDFIFPDNPAWRSSEKAKYQVFYSDFIYHYIDGIFIKKENKGEHLEKFKRLGLTEDGLIGTIEKLKESNKLKIIKTSSCADLIIMLKNNEIDSLLCNYDVMQYLLKGSHTEKEVIFASNLPFIDDYYYLSTKTYPEIIRKFNKWLAKNREYIKQTLYGQLNF